MTYPRHAAALLRLGLPLIGSQLAQYAITLTDGIMLGRYDIGALAGEVLGGGLFIMLFIFGAGFAFAVTPMVATAAAGGEHRQVRRVTRMGMWISVSFGVMTLPVMIWSEPLFLVLGQNPAVAATAQDYLAIQGWSILPALLVLVLRNFLSALERTRIVLFVTLGAVGLNILLNYALIFGNWGAPELGVRGAAIASVSVNLASVLALVAYVIRVTPEHAIFARLWRPDWQAFGQVFRLGWPIGVTNLSEIAVFALAAVMMGWLGTVPLAAHGIAIQIAATTFMLHLGLSGAATVRAARARGQGDALGLRRGALVAMALSAAIAAMTVVVFLTLPKTLIGFFLDAAAPQTAQVMAIGTVLLAAAALFQLGDAMQVIALGLLRGIQDTRVPMVMALVSYWLIGLPVSYGLGFGLGWGGVGIWLGLALGLFSAAGLMMARFWLPLRADGTGPQSP